MKRILILENVYSDFFLLSLFCAALSITLFSFFVVTTPSKSLHRTEMYMKLKAERRTSEASDGALIPWAFIISIALLF